MKKLTAILLCVALAFTLCACGENPSGDNPKPSNSIARGVIKDYKYESKTLGVGWKFGEEWYLADDEEIAQIMGYMTDALTDSAVADTIEKGGTVCDLYAENLDYSTLNLQLQKFDTFFARAQASKMTDEQFVDESYKQIVEAGYDEVIFESLGLVDGEMHKDITTFGDTMRPCLKLSGYFVTEEGDVPFYETMVYVVNGKYMGTFTAASYDIDTTDDVFANFYFL